MTKDSVTKSIFSCMLLCFLRSACAAETKPALEEPQAVKVYSSNFGQKVGTEWSANQTSVTPKGNRAFLGQFGNHTVSLTLKDLPRHAFLRISFELFVIQTWDGNCPQGGARDLWTLEVKDGPKLLHCTFSNAINAANRWQTFPDNYPGASHKRLTGSAETLTLGYRTSKPEEADSVYRLRFAFPHEANRVTLFFWAKNLENLDNESWGLADVKVAALPEAPTKITAEVFEKLWTDLANKDPMRAFQAKWALIGGGEKAARLLRKRLTGSDEPAGPPEIGKLLAQLDDPKYPVRQKATKRLKGIGKRFEALLRNELSRSDSPEVKFRLREILKSFEGGKDAVSSPTDLRRARALHALEVIGSEGAESRPQ